MMESESKVIRYIVISDCPIERNPPGSDVTEVFSDEVKERLREEGHLELQFLMDGEWTTWTDTVNVETEDEEDPDVEPSYEPENE